MAGNQCGQLDRSKVDRLRLVFQMVGGHLDCDIGLQCFVCPIDHRPTIIPFLGRLSANYQFVYGSIIGR